MSDVDEVAPDRTFSRHPEVAWVVLDDEAVLFDARSLEIHILNTTGALVWDCLDGTTTLRQLIHELEAAFGSHDAIRSQVTDLVAMFHRTGLVTADRSPG